MLLAVAVLTAGQVWARGGGPVKFVYASEHGSAVASEANGKVTITITPEAGWRAIDGDVTAVATVANSSVAEARRAEAAADESIGLGGETIAVTCTATNVFTLTLPADVNKNVRVTVKFHKYESVSYINAEGVLCDGEDGHPDKATAYVLDGSETTLGTADAPTWYVCNTDLTYGEGLELYGEVHLILADDVTMNFTNEGIKETAILAYNGLTIYGQTKGTGALKTKAMIGAIGNLVINGVTVEVIDNSYAFYIAGNFIVNGGTVYAKGFAAIQVSSMGASRTYRNVDASRAMREPSENEQTYNVIINGGKVTAIGDEEKGGGGIAAAGDIILGWKNADDFISASSYWFGGSMKVADVQRFIDEDGNIYSGIIATNEEDEDAYHIDGKTLRPYIAQEITIGTSGWATWCSSKEYTLPDGLTAYTISGLSADGKSVVLTPATSIAADTPLLLKGTAGTTYAALWSADGEATGLVSSTVGNVLTFYGNPTDDVITTGYTYEFGKTYVLYQGEFVLVDNNAGLPAHKCLLTLTTAAARQLTMSIGDETTGITTTNYTNSTNSEEAWYGIDGRKLQSKPATKGLYIYKGKKRIVR